MNNIKRIFLTGISMLLCGVAFAQGHEDLLRFSQYNYSFGTARSSAMGGAFSSLGADYSSVVMNPAGLGMYRRSEISISPALTVNYADVDNATDIGSFSKNTGRTQFALNNFGGAFNVYTGTGAVTSFTFGFGYNKLADFNTKTNVQGRSASSMIDYFGYKVADSGFTPPPGGGGINVFPNNVNIWDGALAYNTFLLEYDQGGWFVDNLFDMNQAVLSSSFNQLTKGSVGQYDISGGINFLNLVYFGVGIGVQDIYYRQTNTYTETPENNAAYRLNNFRYIQNLKQDGSAWNVKVGAIIRPIEDLRFSVAFHTPTYIRLDEYYSADMYSYFNDGNAYYDGVEYLNSNSYQLRTPSRLLAGLSYTINAGRSPLGVISFDYERVWYNNMRMFRSGWDIEDFDVTDEVNAIYKPADNFRVGAEVVLSPQAFLRLGYAFYGSMYENSNLDKYGKSSNYSGGFGYRWDDFGLDIAYVYMRKKSLPANVFYYEGLTSGTYNTKNNRHNLVLTASYRF